MKSLSVLVAASMILSVSAGSAQARGFFGDIGAAAPQSQSSQMMSGANGMTPLQQQEVNALIASINAPVNPFNAHMELQMKAQQQARLQQLMGQLSVQKSMREQMRTADPVTASALDERIRQHEISRLMQDLNSPVLAANQQTAAQQASIKAQQQVELRRLQNASAGALGAQREMQAAAGMNVSTGMSAQSGAAMVGPTAQQQREIAMLVNSLNSPIQNPYSYAQEMQFKQQQQMKLQQLTNTINQQKAMQEQMQRVDASTAASMQQNMVNNEINRLRGQINSPVIPSTPADVQQQLSVKAQQQEELNRLTQSMGSSSLMVLDLQQFMNVQNKMETMATNVLRQQHNVSQQMVGNMR